MAQLARYEVAANQRHHGQSSHIARSKQNGERGVQVNSSPGANLQVEAFAAAFSGCGGLTSAQINKVRSYIVVAAGSADAKMAIYTSFSHI
jgi:hypothetical protein